MGRRLSLTITSSAVRRADSETAEPNEHALSRSRTGSPPDKQITLPLCPPQVKRKEPYFHSAIGYSGLQLYEEIVLGFPLPLRERDRVRGKGAATSLLIQTKNALQRFAFVRRGRSWVPSPLAGEGQGEGKSSGNESTHPNEKCCKSLL